MYNDNDTHILNISKSVPIMAHFRLSLAVEFEWFGRPHVDYITCTPNKHSFKGGNTETSTPVCRSRMPIYALIVRIRHNNLNLAPPADALRGRT